MRPDHTETDHIVAGNGVAVVCDQDGSNVALESDAGGEALRNADYASLTRRAVTDNSRALVDEMLRLIATVDPRERQRVSRAAAFKQAVEGFLGDLLAAGEGWVYRPTGHGRATKRTGHSRSTNNGVSPRTLDAVRAGLRRLGMLEEMPGQQGFSKPATRFKATPVLEQLAARYGIEPSEADRHFLLPLPQRPLLLKGASTWTRGDKIEGEVMEIDYSDPKVTALERTITDLNKFIDGFDIRGGTHRGYCREFNCGDHKKFEWDLGGRLYGQGKHNYQRLSGAERRKMTIDGVPVSDLDVRASNLTIFQALGRQPFDFANNPDLDPYALPGLRRDVVKEFITASFGRGQLLTRWPKDIAEEYAMLPVSQVRDAVATAYPLLRELRQNDAEPPIWAKLMYLESEAVLNTMLALKDLGIPSLSVHDSILVPRDSEELAKVTLAEHYHVTTGAIPNIVTKR
jgi:hypothetical protein